MQIDFALILSAGKGTRMGEIGKFLPKPMWPIFNKTLLELQINYCHDLGIKKIFINTHYLAEKIRDFIAEKNFALDIIELFEPELLDSGGAVHNFAQHSEVNYSGNVLLINADQFLLFEEKIIFNSLNLLMNHRACLFGIKVDSGSSYNELKIEKSKLVGIEKHIGNKEYVTYSGLGLLRLDGLKEIRGSSRFFETVADFRSEAIAVSVPSLYEYWDFGTAKIYHENMIKIAQLTLKDEDNLIVSFLKKHKAIDEKLENYCSIEKRSVDLEGESQFYNESITWQRVNQKV